MDRERWQKIDAVFKSALELPRGARAAYLDAACAGDEDLRREVESLIAHDSTEGFLSSDVGEGKLRLLLDGDSRTLVGETLGSYRVLEKIGEGGMGEVYLASHSRTGRKAALKLLPAHSTRDPERVRRFEREARAVLALNHPNIVTVYDIEQARGLSVIASEFIEGETLRGRVSRGPLDISEALGIAAQVASALEAAHAAGIVHRDIKPENVMLRPDGYVKVLDFGLAKLTGLRNADFGLRIDGSNAALNPQSEIRNQQSTTPGVLMGTPAYMSPEQARGLATDARTDIWSLGVVLYEMLAGQAPFAGESAGDIISSVLRDEPRPLADACADTPEQLGRLVSKTLRKNRDERYQTAGELLLELKSLRRRLEFEEEFGRGPSPEKADARDEGASETQGRADAEEQSESARGDTPRSVAHAPQAAPPNNFTVELSPLIGRVREIIEIVELLRRDGTRLLTLTGAGGTGKTCLARASAKEALGDFADGVFFIDLAPVGDPEGVVAAIAHPLGVKESGGKPLAEALRDFLSGRRVLLVLDNFEQVLDAAPLVKELLTVAPLLKALVTSRAPLRLSAEQEFAVPPLDLPAPSRSATPSELMSYAAIALFVERARAARPAFSLSEENARAVTEICVRLDGLPLAIELAAARVKLLSTREILARLEGGLKLLTGGPRDTPARQQTMRGAISWSYDLLEADERVLLKRLSVFAGGCTLEAAEEVCGAQGDLRTGVLDGIASLVDKSLLVRREQADGESRFRMLGVVREYAAEALAASGESNSAGRSHADYFLALAERAEPELKGGRQAEWLNRLEDEHDNLRAALGWMIGRDAEGALRLAGALSLFWNIRGHHTDGRRLLERALRSDGSDVSAARAKALSGVGLLAWRQGDYDSAREFYEESLRLGKAVGDRRRVALASRGLGIIAYLRGDNSSARAYFGESLKIGRELADSSLISITLCSLGESARVEGDYAAARSFYEEAVAFSRRAGNKSSLSINLTNLGAMFLYEGDDDAALRSYAEALKIFRELAHKSGISFSLDGLAAVAARRGEPARAARLAGAAESLREEIGYELETTDRIFREAYISGLHEALTAEEYDASFREGRTMGIDEAASQALRELGKDS